VIGKILYTKYGIINEKKLLIYTGRIHSFLLIENKCDEVKGNKDRT